MVEHVFGILENKLRIFDIGLPQTLHPRDVLDSAFLTTYHNLHIQHLKRSS